MKLLKANTKIILILKVFITSSVISFYFKKKFIWFTVKAQKRKNLNNLTKAP